MNLNNLFILIKYYYIFSNFISATMYFNKTRKKKQYIGGGGKSAFPFIKVTMSKDFS